MRPTSSHGVWSAFIWCYEGFEFHWPPLGDRVPETIQYAVFIPRIAGNRCAYPRGLGNRTGPCGRGRRPNTICRRSTHFRLLTEYVTLGRLPAVYPYNFADAGGLLRYRRAAGYANHVAEKPSELPVPVKFELVINVKTAKALGLTAAAPRALDVLMR